MVERIYELWARDEDGGDPCECEEGSFGFPVKLVKVLEVVG